MRHQKMRPKSWRKNLYDNEIYEDNYTDPSFLKGLQKNLNVKRFTYWDAIIGVTRLNMQITTVTLFLIIFYKLYTNAYEAPAILALSSGVTLCSYFCYIRRAIATLREDFKTVFSVLIFGFLMAPMMHTLTESISTDTIYSTTFFMMFLHLIFFDYGLHSFVVSKAMSLNAALFASICLASRLATSMHAFVLLVVAVEFFALMPLFLAKFWHPIWLMLCGSIAGYTLMGISGSLLTTYCLVLAFVNILCPCIFVRQQRHKNNIHGPWDEAIVFDMKIDVKKNVES